MLKFVFIYLNTSVVFSRVLQTDPQSAGITIGLLDSQLYEMQNEFLLNLIEKYTVQLSEQENTNLQPNITVQTTKFESQTQIQECLTNGDCQVSLQYETIQELNVDGRVLSDSDLERLPMPVLDDPVLNLVLPDYAKQLGRQFVILVYWLPSVFAFFLVFAVLVVRMEILSKPEREDVFTTPLDIDQRSLRAFQEPEEDMIYGAMRNASSVLTCRKASNAPLAQGLSGVALAVSYWLLAVCVSLQSAVDISRHLSTKAVSDLVLRSQVDGNLICADQRFKFLLIDSPLAKPSAFAFNENILDPTQVQEHTFTACSDIVVFQSQVAYYGFLSDGVLQYVQHVNVLKGLQPKKYDLLLSPSLDGDFRSWIELQTQNDLKGILLQDTLGLESDIDFLPLMPEQLNLAFLLQSQGYQYLASLAAIISIAFLVISIIDLSRRRDIYCKKDSSDRIELMKIKMKMRQESQAGVKEKYLEKAQKIVQEYSSRGMDKTKMQEEAKRREEELPALTQKYEAAVKGLVLDRN